MVTCTYETFTPRVRKHNCINLFQYLHLQIFIWTSGTNICNIKIGISNLFVNSAMSKSCKYFLLMSTCGSFWTTPTDCCGFQHSISSCPNVVSDKLLVYKQGEVVSSWLGVKSTVNANLATV